LNCHFPTTSHCLALSSFPDDPHSGLVYVLLRLSGLGVLAAIVRLKVVFNVLRRVVAAFCESGEGFYPAARSARPAGVIHMSLEYELSFHEPSLRRPFRVSSARKFKLHDYRTALHLVLKKLRMLFS
jgi:hypothetical protein